MNPQNGPVDLPQVQNDTDDVSGQPPAQNDPVAQSPDPLAPPAASTLDNNPTFTEVALPVDAEDSDLIEKEWVDRAKQIVEHTREDPYEQQRALSQMKADYLKKRYNKDIKISEG